MLNRPFSATNTNIFNEKTCSTTPANVFGQNVLLSQDQHRKVCDTLTTQFNTIPSCPQMLQPLNTYSNANCIGNYQHQCPCPSYQQQQPGFCQAYQQPLPSWQCPPSPFQIPPAQNLYNYNCEDQLRLNQLQNRTAMELLQMQRQCQPCPPRYQLKFHIDNETSTADLFPTETKGRADLRNLASLLTTNWPYWLQNDPNNRLKPDHKKLIIRDVVEPLTTTIIDDIKEDEIQKYCKTKCPKLPGQRKVTFKSDDPSSDAECQVHFCCHCCDHHGSNLALDSDKLTHVHNPQREEKPDDAKPETDDKPKPDHEANAPSTSSADEDKPKRRGASAERKKKQKKAPSSGDKDRKSRSPDERRKKEKKKKEKKASAPSGDKNKSADRKGKRRKSPTPSSSSSASSDESDESKQQKKDRKQRRKLKSSKRAEVLPSSSSSNTSDSDNVIS